MGAADPSDPGRAGFDLIVVGAGTAGIPCAIAAAELGARVAVLEKDVEIGGTLHLSGGELSAAGARRQRARGVDDSPDFHFAEVMETGGGQADPALLRLAVEEAPRTIDWIEEIGFPFAAEPEIFRVHEQYSRPRTYVGPDFGLSILETLRPRFAEQVAAGRIELLLEHALGDFLLEDGAVTGVRARGPEGEVEVRAAATVLATGGYAHDEPFFRRVTTGGPRLVTGARPASTGDGIHAALRLGARFRGAEHQYRVVGPVELEPGRANGWEAVANLVPNDRAPREILVNLRGERFVAEDEERPDVKVRTVCAQPGSDFWIVFDEAALAGQPLFYRMRRASEERPEEVDRRWSAAGIRERATEGICAWSAPTVRELAALAGIDPAGLERTAAAWNRAVRSGHDPLGRRDLQHPLDQPPFYAVHCHPTTFLTWGGIEVDAELRVLGADGRPLSGLYAAGEALGAAALMGNTICGGVMVTGAISFGRLLGRRLAPPARPGA